jgi:hypothetical protein
MVYAAMMAVLVCQHVFRDTFSRVRTVPNTKGTRVGLAFSASLFAEEPRLQILMMSKGKAKVNLTSFRGVTMKIKILK